MHGCDVHNCLINAQVSLSHVWRGQGQFYARLTDINPSGHSEATEGTQHSFINDIFDKYF